jgi:hypothetical protein
LTEELGLFVRLGRSDGFRRTGLVSCLGTCVITSLDLWLAKECTLSSSILSCLQFEKKKTTTTKKAIHYCCIYLIKEIST